MPEFRYGHADAKDWREAAKSCLAQLGQGPANLGFLYVTDHYADQLKDIVANLKHGTGVPHWVGTVGLGVCATGKEYLDEGAMAVMHWMIFSVSSRSLSKSVSLLRSEIFLS